MNRMLVRIVLMWLGVCALFMGGGVFLIVVFIINHDLIALALGLIMTGAGIFQYSTTFHGAYSQMAAAFRLQRVLRHWKRSSQQEVVTLTTRTYGEVAFTEDPLYVRLAYIRQDQYRKLNDPRSTVQSLPAHLILLDRGASTGFVGQTEMIVTYRLIHLPDGRRHWTINWDEVIFADVNGLDVPAANRGSARLLRHLRREIANGTFVGKDLP